MNFLYLDTETTGLNHDKHDIIQLACIPIINGVQYESFNEFCHPLNYETIDPAAIQSHGISVEKMKTFQSPQKMLAKFITFVKKFNCQFIIAGHNVGFDKRMMGAWFTKHGKADDFFTLFTLHTHDTFSRAQTVKNLIKSKDLKLSSLAKYWDIPIVAHEALSDISATVLVDRQLAKLLNEEPYTPEEIVPIDSIKINTEFSEPAQLHLHSMNDMSLSVPEISEWKTWCQNTKTPAFSIVDHGPAISVYHMAKVFNPSEPNPVIGIPGIGLYLYFDDIDTLYPVNAWAINNEGYYSLIKLSSLGYDNAKEINGITVPRLHIDVLKQYMNGLKWGGPDIYSPVGQALLQGDAALAESHLKKYIETFKDDFYLEFNPISIKYTFTYKLCYQKIKSNSCIDGDWARSYNKFLASMSDKYSLKCVPVCGASFIEKKDKLVHDCIVSNAFKDETHFLQSYHAKNAKELYIDLKIQLGDWLTEDMFTQWIEHTLEIARLAANIKIEYKYTLPKIQIPKHIQETTDDYNKQTLLYTLELCKSHGRWNDDPVYVERFKKEIDVIYKNESLNLLPYFLLYEDIGAFARSQNILQNLGRGSAGGSLLSYYLKIIHIDPIKEKLPFERFLSHARIRAKSLADIDLDLGNRAPILKYLHEKYKLGFAQICVFQKMKTKTALKDAMWALYGRNRKDSEIERLCSLIPDSPQGVDEYDFLYGYTDNEGNIHEGVVTLVPELKKFFESYPQIEVLLNKLIGITRSWGRHASAFVISTEDLAETKLPVMRMSDAHIGANIQVTQNDAPVIEACGLVKADILGVTTIQMISDCMELIKQRTNKDFLQEDSKGVALIYRLPDNPKVYEDFRREDTDSSFQFNTGLIKGFVKRFNPSSREDLSALTALCRPGALDLEVLPGVSATNYYIEVKNKEREPEYIHPDLKSILEETYSVCCIAKDQKVTTIDGLKKIQDVQIGDMVLTEDGTYQQVVNTLVQGVKPTVRIRTTMGEEVVCTDDHRLLTQHGWVEAKDLNKHHLIKFFPHYLYDNLPNIDYQSGLWASIISIAPDTEIETYDLSVDINHSFVVGGHVVHNCYQEQLMEMLVKFCGYTLEQSDQIRSAIAKKKRDVMLKAFEQVRTETQKIGWSLEQANKLCHILDAYSNYSFNRAHSRCYAELGYITMYLKNQYPLEWWTAVLNNTNKEDKMRQFIHFLGDTIKSPTIKAPNTQFTIIGKHIVAPISAVKQVGPVAVQELASKGPFESLDDYIERVDHRKFNIKHFTALIHARALEDFMDPSLPYAEARKVLLHQYITKRKAKKTDDIDILNTDPIHVFLKEQEYNKCFNKSLVTDPAIRNIILEKLPMIRCTTKKNIPFFMPNPIDHSARAKDAEKQVPILSNIDVATLLASRDTTRDVAMILLYKGSNHISGKSKKSGKPYEFVKVVLSDGRTEIECLWWDQTRALSWSVNKLVYVQGKISLGWNKGVQMNITHIERVDDVKVSDSEKTSIRVKRRGVRHSAS